MTHKKFIIAVAWMFAGLFIGIVGVDLTRGDKLAAGFHSIGIAAALGIVYFRSKLP